MSLDQTLLKRLDEKYDLYLKESLKFRDSYGWNSRIKCDGLLFNCLWSIAGADIDIMAARDASGKWHRHPSFECYALGQSGSEISRDMLLGLSLWILKNKRLDVITELIEYGKKNHWIMGKGDISRTYVNPSFKATLYEICHFLGGPSHWERFIPRDWYFPIPFMIPASLSKYHRHLLILSILANCLMRNPHQREIDLLTTHRFNQPGNALIDAVCNRFTGGDYSSTVELLLNNIMFPDNHLPTSLNFDSDYLWSRDMNSSDWQPDYHGEPKTNPGIDWLFAASIVKGLI